MCLVIFLVIRYINKNYNDENHNIKTKNNLITNTKTKTDTETDTDTDTDTDNNVSKDKKRIKKKLRYEKYKELLREQEKKKYLLELEKQSILDVIDELSNINQQKIIKNTEIIKKNNALKKNIPKNNYLENDYLENRNTDEMIDNNPQYSGYSLINSNFDCGESLFYNVNKNINYKDKKNPNYIKGIYIESPYEE